MKKESDYEFRIEADMRLLVPAYSLYINQLRQQIDEDRKYYENQSISRDIEDVNREKVIFGFVLQHMGRDKLMQLGRAIDEEQKKRTGDDQGYEDFLNTEY